MLVEVRQLGPNDLSQLESLLDLFGEAFDRTEVDAEHRPNAEYLQRLVGGGMLIVLAAQTGEGVVGGITAYELKKLEQQRSELYIYDLAVAPGHRRRGIATMLIEQLKKIGRERGASVLFVQADTDEDDEPAIALYSKLGTGKEVLHFDLEIQEIDTVYPAL